MPAKIVKKLCLIKNSLQSAAAVHSTQSAADYEHAGKVGAFKIKHSVIITPNSPGFSSLSSFTTGTLTFSFPFDISSAIICSDQQFTERIDLTNTNVNCQKQSGVSRDRKVLCATTGNETVHRWLCSVAKETSTANKMANKESDAQEYLKKHKIMELFENLTAQLIYERPGEYF